MMSGRLKRYGLGVRRKTVGAGLVPARQVSRNSTLNARATRGQGQALPLQVCSTSRVLRKLSTVLVLAVLLWGGAGDAKKAGGPPPFAEEVDNSRPLKLPLSNPKIVVKKGARRLTLYAGGAAVREYPVALGFSPEGDKVRQGDGRTPEGTFYVSVKNAKSAFFLSLGLSYPNAEAAERGLRDKLITRRQYERIVGAIRSRRTPPWDTRLGGEIFIHGSGSKGDWTWGCVALDNENIKELFDAVPLGTPVVIEK